MKESGKIVESSKSEIVRWWLPPTGRSREGAGIAIQGYEGSFHQVAARHFFGKDVEVIPCATFRDVVKIAVKQKRK